jgi:hypothetical protein
MNLWDPLPDVKHWCSKKLRFSPRFPGFPLEFNKFKSNPVFGDIWTFLHFCIESQIWWFSRAAALYFWMEQSFFSDWGWSMRTIVGDRPSEISLSGRFSGNYSFYFPRHRVNLFFVLSQEFKHIWVSRISFSRGWARYSWQWTQNIRSLVSAGYRNFLIISTKN